MKLTVCFWVIVLVSVIQAYLEILIGVDYAPGTDRVKRVLHKTLVSVGGAITGVVIAWAIGLVSFNLS